jgi:O-antigen ligase/tetratricopeptide (TPR) repeat protein
LDMSQRLHSKRGLSEQSSGSSTDAELRSKRALRYRPEAMLDDLRRYGGTIVPQHAARIRRVSVLVAVAGVPLLFTRFSQDPFNLPKLALLIAAVTVAAAALAVELLQGVRFPGLSEMRLPALALAVPLLIATIASPYRWWSLLGEYQRFQGLIPHLLVIAVGVLVAVTFVGEARTPAHWLVLAGAVAGGYSVLQYFGIDLFDWGQQFGGEVEVTSTLGNTNFSGGFLSICFPVAAALLAIERSPRRAIETLLIGAGVIVSFSQGAWVASAAGTVFAAGFYLAPRIAWAKLAGAALAVLLAMASLGYVVKGIFEASDQGGASTVQLRSWWWESAIDLTLERPIIGHGPNSFAVDSWGTRPIEESSVQGFDYTNDPHSGYLAMSTGAGLLGLAGLLLAIGWALRRAWRSQDMLVAGAAGGIVAYAVDAITTVDEMGLRLGLWVCIGMAVAATSLAVAVESKPARKTPKSKRSQPKAAPLRQPALVVSLVVVAVASIVYSVALVFADTQVRHGITALRTGDVDEGKSRFDSALKVWPSNSYEHSYAFFLGELAYSREDEDLLQDAAEAYGYLDGFPDVSGLRDRGRMYAKYSEFEPSYLDDAADSFLEAMRIDPYNISLTPEGASVLLRAERYEDLIEVVAPVIDVLGERNATLWPALGLAYEATGETASAQEALDTAQQLAPEDPLTLELAEKLGQANS